MPVSQQRPNTLIISQIKATSILNSKKYKPRQCLRKQTQSHSTNPPWLCVTSISIITQNKRLLRLGLEKKEYRQIKVECAQFVNMMVFGKCKDNKERTAQSFFAQQVLKHGHQTVPDFVRGTSQCCKTSSFHRS